jgi:hypothetical protein
MVRSHISYSTVSSRFLGGIQSGVGHYFRTSRVEGAREGAGDEETTPRLQQGKRRLHLVVPLPPGQHDQLLVSGSLTLTITLRRFRWRLGVEFK